jgi:N-methylhydantoinase B
VSKAYPDQLSRFTGTMNNVQSAADPQKRTIFYLLQTIAGGTGANQSSDGMSAVHSHMTNTLNTPIEALEYAYPLRIRRYEVRKDSGGCGKYHGGDGIIREIEFITNAQVTLISERRSTSPYGLAGGEPGKMGINLLIHLDKEISLPGRVLLM